MPNIVIIGASCAGHHVALSLRQRSRSCAITLITEEPFPCYDRRKLLAYFAGTVKEKELFLCAADFYAGRNITFLRESKVVSVNPGRSSLSLRTQENRRSLDFDLLVVSSGSSTPLPDIDGINKSGVFRLDGLADFKQARSQVLSDAVCVIGCNSLTASFARTLASRSIEVKLIADGACADMPENVDRIPTQVVQIIGESGVQAVKLKEGKIIGASLVAVMAMARPNTGFLEGSAVELADGAVLVDENMRTNFENIFACGTACVSKAAPPADKSWDQTAREGDRLAEIIFQHIGG